MPADLRQVFGGVLAAGNATDAVESFSLTTRTWKSLAPLPSGPRQHAAGISLGKGLVLLGGLLEGMKHVHAFLVLIPCHMPIYHQLKVRMRTWKFARWTAGTRRRGWQMVLLLLKARS